MSDRSIEVTRHEIELPEDSRRFVEGLAEMFPPDPPNYEDVGRLRRIGADLVGYMLPIAGEDTPLCSVLARMSDPQTSDDEVVRLHGGTWGAIYESSFLTGKVLSTFRHAYQEPWSGDRVDLIQRELDIKVREGDKWPDSHLLPPVEINIDGDMHILGLDAILPRLKLILLFGYGESAIGNLALFASYDPEVLKECVPVATVVDEDARPHDLRLSIFEAYPSRETR